MFTLFMDLGKIAGKAIQAGVAEYKRLGADATPGKLSIVILKETAAWKPEIKGKALLTPGLRSQLAQALAGLAYNIGAAEAGKAVV